MIAVDTNVLVHAHREESPKHRAALTRLGSLSASPTPAFTVSGGAPIRVQPSTRRPNSVNAAPACVKIRAQTRAVISLAETLPLPPREPVPYHRLDERRGEFGRRIEHREVTISRAETRIGRARPERIRPMATRHHPVARRHGRRYQDGCDSASTIGAAAHVNVAPKPGAAFSTSSIRPSLSRSSGSATVSSNAHSCVRNVQASSGSPTASTTPLRPGTTRPAPRICPAGMRNPRFVVFQAMSLVVLAHS